MKQFTIVKVAGEQTYIRHAPTYVNAVVLTAGAGQTMATPASGNILVFSSDGDFYAKPNSVATVPTVAVTDGTASELNPAAWCLNQVTGIGLIAPAARKITLTYYSTTA